MKLKVLVAILLFVPFFVNAFEVKGYLTGADISSLDLSACKRLPNADSGIPGFSCNTTLGGDNAELRIAVFDNKVVALIFNVASGQMQPVLAAFTEKYGRPSQSNRYIQDFDWRQSGKSLSVKENRIARGYSVMSIDWPLFERAQDAAKAKAKGDI